MVLEDEDAPGDMATTAVLTAQLLSFTAKWLFFFAAPRTVDCSVCVREREREKGSRS